jgi:hypothetical protein
MRKVYSREIEAGRQTAWEAYRSEPGDRHGLFKLRCPTTNRWLTVLVGSAEGWEEMSLPLPAWEHCSVSGQVRTPDWDEMCFVKKCFWDDDETVVQFHPAESDYINFHDHTLHMWRVIGVEFPVPPKQCV